MVDSKLKFYVGNVTDGGNDGTASTSVQCLYPLAWMPNIVAANSIGLYNSTYCRVPIKFALRCDEGYRADDVKLTFDVGKFYIGNVENDYSGYPSSTGSISEVKVGTVGNANRIIRLISGFYPEYAIKIYISFTEVKL